MRTFILVLCCLVYGTAAFAPSPPRQRASSHPRSEEIILAESSQPEMTQAEEKVYGLLEDIHASQLEFRVVVVGNGAILESTSLLGPTLKLGQSPKTNANIATFASEDASFEFHLMTAQVDNIQMAEKASPTGRTMRILRFANADAKPMCSLILADDSKEAAEWYNSMTSKYGEAVELK